MDITTEDLLRCKRAVIIAAEAINTLRGPETRNSARQDLLALHQLIRKVETAAGLAAPAATTAAATPEAVQ